MSKAADRAGDTPGRESLDFVFTVDSMPEASRVEKTFTAFTGLVSLPPEGDNRE